MDKSQAHMNTVKSIVFGLSMAVFAVAFVASAPVAHAQFADGSDLSAGFGDGGGCCSYDTTGGYGGGYTPDYSGGYGSTGYSSGYSMGGYGGSSYYPSSSYPSSNYSTPSNTYAPTNTWDNGNTTAWDNGNTTNSGNTSTYAPVTDNGNTNNSYNTASCMLPGSCSTTIDDHSVVNANTSINAPTTVTISNPPPTNTQIVYNTPSSYAPAPVYQPVYQPTYQQPLYQAPIQPIYHNPNTPYVTLSAVPYTGLDLGPFGTVMYWSFLVLWCLFMAYLVVVKRTHEKIARSMKAFLLGPSNFEEEEDEEGVETASVETQIAKTPITSPVRAAQATDADAIDEFVLSQIHRSA